MSHEDTTQTKTIYRQKNIIKNAGGWHGGWFLGFCGALVYFLQQTSTFGGGVLAFLKAMVWPAFVAYGLLRFLKM